MTTDETIQVCMIEDRAYLHVTGKDADDFLHAQLSQDIKGLAADRAPLAGWHDARGRCLALFRLVATADGRMLVTHGEVAESVLSGLGKYVLRADVRIGQMTDWRGRALIGDARAWLQAAGIKLAEDINACAESGDCHFVRLGDECVEVYGPASAIAAFELDGDAPAGLSKLSEIELGLPEVSANVSGQYVAQMLNLDRLDAVSFNKGCYPGQEVIARAHHLGEVKRRMCRFEFSADHDVAPGSSVVDYEGEHAGEVICAARVADRHEGLAVVRTSAIEDGLFLADGDRSMLRELPLPYDAD